MDQASYLNIILAKYAGTFDIEKNRVIDGREYTAYGYFSSLGEKYVLVKKAKLWSVKAYEHAFFLTEDACSPHLLTELMGHVTDYMEPVLVRGGEKYMRGHSEARLVVADMETEQIFTNGAGRSLAKMYRKAFAEAARGAKGYNELYAQESNPREGSI